MKGWTEWGERTRDELDGPKTLADELDSTRLVLEDDRVVVREELLPRRRGDDPFLQSKAACLSALVRKAREEEGGARRTSLVMSSRTLGLSGMSM